MADQRTKLRAAITTRDEAHKAKDEATATLKRAEAVVAATEMERDAASRNVAKAEAEHAKVIAKAIRKGATPDVAITVNIKTAQSALAEIESRARMAQAARDQIADERTEADRKATEAEAAVADAALAVVVADCEEAAAPLETLLSQLCALDDIVHAAGWLRGGDGIRPRELTSKLAQAINRLRPLRQALASVRPARIILTGTSEEATAGRLESYRKALAKNADATLADIPEPQIKHATLPSGNAIEGARIAAATKVGAAA